MREILPPTIGRSLNARTPERLSTRPAETTMAAACCAFTKPTGDPCAAYPLPGRDFCLFHDPAQTAAPGPNHPNTKYPNPQPPMPNTPLFHVAHPAGVNDPEQGAKQ